MSLSTLLLSLAPLAAPLAPQNPEIPADTEIQTTESGLQYSVLQPGEGLRPGHGDRVIVHFTGWLEDGTLIVSTRTTGEPIEVGIGQQKIKGLNEGLQLIEPGGRIKLTIPPELGYGSRGRGKNIPPDATLVYDIELVQVSARVPEFLPLDETESEVTASGLRVQVLERGGGIKRGPKDPVWVEYTYWDTLGECHFATIMTPTPVILAAKSLPFKFFDEVFQLMGEGDEALFEVPPELLFGDRKSGALPPNSVTIWRIRLARVFRKPAFPKTPEDGYQTTSNGLKYRVLREGRGRTPQISDRVRLHYTGWLTDGKEIATSYNKQRQPQSVAVSDVIPGLGMALMLSKEGGIIEVVIPGKLGYGQEGRRPLIQPNADLVYIAELIQIY